MYVCIYKAAEEQAACRKAAPPALRLYERASPPLHRQNPNLPTKAAAPRLTGIPNAALPPNPAKA